MAGDLCGPCLGQQFKYYNMIYLQGYEVEYSMPNNQVTKLVVCASCARAMRGRFKTQKIIKNVDFACAMGNGN
jgi:hypothetical protein